MSFVSDVHLRRMEGLDSPVKLNTSNHGNLCDARSRTNIRSSIKLQNFTKAFVTYWLALHNNKTLERLEKQS